MRGERRKRWVQKEGVGDGEGNGESNTQAPCECMKDRLLLVLARSNSLPFAGSSAILVRTTQLGPRDRRLSIAWVNQSNRKKKSHDNHMTVILIIDVLTGFTFMASLSLLIFTPLNNLKEGYTPQFFLKQIADQLCTSTDLLYTLFIPSFFHLSTTNSASN